MSQENVEAVRRMWDAWQAGDVQTALSFYDPDVEWDGTNLPDGHVARGHEAIMDHIRRWADQWDDWTVEVERIVDEGASRWCSSCGNGGGARAGWTWMSVMQSCTPVEMAR